MKHVQIVAIISVSLALIALFGASQACSQETSSVQEMLTAAREGDLPKVKQLLTAEPNLLNAGDERSCNALHFAVNEGHTDVVDHLLSAGADIQALDVDGDTPLHWAACTDNADMIDLLLKHGAEIDALNHGQETPILYSTKRRIYPVVEKLAELGADLEIPNDYGRTPLIWTAREGGDLKMARLLLRLGADVDAIDRFESSALELAAWRGFRTLVGILLDAGTSTDLRPGMGNDLLGMAADNGLDRLYQRLVADGVTIDVAMNDYSSILHVAAGGGSEAIVKDLINRGAAVDAVDMYGWTPLHYAADRKRGAVTEALLSSGAGRDARSLSGHSPLSLAKAKGVAEVIRPLEQAGHTASRRDFPRLSGAFLGQGDPPAQPEPFALDIVASCWGEHGSVSFTPDGREAFWSGYTDIPDSGYHRGTILTSRIVGKHWTPPEPASFLGEYRGDVPFAAPDGRQVFFLSRRPLESGDPTGGEHIWVVQRSGDGWGEPQPLPSCVNDMPQHWQISVAANGNLYFSSRRPEPSTQGVYVSRTVDGVYTEPEFLGFEGSTPYIAPDESLLLTTQNFGRDIIVRVRRDNGTWGHPVSIGEAYPAVEGMCPKLSPDGRAFFFISQRTGNNSDFWVDAGFLKDLKR